MDPAVDLAGHDVLVVEDGASRAGQLAVALLPNGAVLRFAVDAIDALEQIRYRMPDIVVLDLELVGNGGWDLLRGLRLIGTPLPAPIVAIVSGRDDARKADALGAEIVLTGPFTRAAAREAVENALSSHPRVA